MVEASDPKDVAHSEILGTLRCIVSAHPLKAITRAREAADIPTRLLCLRTYLPVR